MLNQNKLGQNSRQLLAAETPLQTQRRTMNDASANSISVDNPVEDYKRLISSMLDENLDDEEQMKRYKAIAAETRNLVWKFLFEEPQPPSAERQTKAGNLLKEHKMDASFFVPWDYNDWVIELRDELLKRKNFDFWHNAIVKKELGPCWARDCDYFDDMEDTEPAKFYQHAGAKAAWEKETTNQTLNTTSENNVVPPSTSTSSNTSARIPTAADLKISLVNPLEDYKKLINIYLTENTLSDDEQIQSIYSSIAESARNAVWSLLFDEPQPTTAERQTKAGDVLKEHKTDAGFYAPWVYNEWVVKLKDEVVKHQLLDFWHNQMVKRELGLCWARDSDYFDDMQDAEPANFYKHGGATAAWESEKNKTPNCPSTDSCSLPSSTAPVALANSNVESQPRVPKADDLNISLETPLEDYKKLVNTYLTENPLSDDEKIESIYAAIAESARKTVWSLLFDDPQPPTVERQNKAGDLLREHKTDAGFYAPWVYNEWIVKLKNEVLKREHLEFWRNQMVKRELGLCWARDSDYFDDMEDPEPSNFYKNAGCIAAWLNEEDQNRANEHSSGDQ